MVSYVTSDSPFLVWYRVMPSYLRMVVLIELLPWQSYHYLRFHALQHEALFSGAFSAWLDCGKLHKYYITIKTDSYKYYVTIKLTWARCRFVYGQCITMLLFVKVVVYVVYQISEKGTLLQ